MRKIFPACCGSADEQNAKTHGAKSKDRDFLLHVVLLSDLLVTRHSSLAPHFIAHLVSSVIYHAERRELSNKKSWSSTRLTGHSNVAQDLSREKTIRSQG
jgi:hypothetical protein